MYPMSMLQVANGINVTAVSQNDQVDFGFLVDPHLVPDPWIYAEGIQEALCELEQAAAQMTREPVVEDSASLPIAAVPAVAEGPGEEAHDAPAPEAFFEDEPTDLRLLMGELGKKGAFRRHTP
jgi:hypothetical protein